MTQALYQFHVPESINMDDKVSVELKNRIMETVKRAILRVASNSNSNGQPIELLQNESGSLLERFDSDRLRASGEGYGIPSYDEGGEEVEVSLKAANIVGELATTAGDTIVRQPFPNTTVLSTGSSFFYAGGGSYYLTAQNLQRAMDWGNILFGGLGFAVFQKSGASLHDDPYHVVPLTKPLDIHELGGLSEQPSGDEIGNEDLHLVQDWARLVSSQTHSTVTVVTRDGVILLRTNSDKWSPAMYENVLSQVAEAEKYLSFADVNMITSNLVQQGRTVSGEQGIVDVLVNMDRAVFASIPWTQRAEYLEILITAGAGEREEIAILEMIHGTHSVAELEAIFAILRQRGVYPQLFDELDARVISLLRELGKYRPQGEINWQFLVNMFLDLGFLPATPVFAQPRNDPLREFDRIAAGVEDWLRSTWEGIRFLVTQPAKVAEGLLHLVEFLWILEKARPKSPLPLSPIPTPLSPIPPILSDQWRGDKEAQALVNQMMRQAGLAVIEAIRGLEYVEELGTPFNNRGKGMEITRDIIGRLKVLLVIELLTWFIGIGEIKAAISGARITERIAGLARILRSVRIFGRATDVTSTAARIERVLEVLSNLAKLTDQTQVMRIVDFLPEDQLTNLARLAEAVDLPPNSNIDILRTALEGNSALLSSVDEIANTLSVFTRLENKVGIGKITDEMARGMHVLLAHAPWPDTELLRLIDNIPVEHLDEFMQAMPFLKPNMFINFGVDSFTVLAQRPRILSFIREVGSDVFDVTFQRAGANGLDAFEDFVEGVALKRSQIGDPVAYQHFIDRLGQGEVSAFDEVADALNAQRLSQATQAGQAAALGLKRLEDGNYTHLLQYLDELQDATLSNAKAARIAELPEKELRGLEHMAREYNEFSTHTDWIDMTLDIEPSTRRSLLELMDDVAPHTDEGLYKVLKDFYEGGVMNLQGAHGQLNAGRTLLRRYPGRRLRFEVSAIRREIDIVVEGGPFPIKVEVKTNINDMGTPSFSLNQVRKDLVTHSQTGYQDLLYMYHPNVASQLEDAVRQRMLRLFDDPDATLVQWFQNNGYNMQQARQALESWLPNGVTTYDLL